MTGYNPALAALAQKSALDLVTELGALDPYPRSIPALEEMAATNRDSLIAVLLPPREPKRGRPRGVTRPYRGESPWL